MTATAVAYDTCRRVTRASGSSFYRGMSLLPHDRRDAIFAIYALARRIDDIADGPLPPQQKLAELDELRRSLACIDDSRDPVLGAVADAARRFPIPLDAFEDLVDGAEMDVRGRSYATFSELESYCRCVAGSIGRLSLGVFVTSDRTAAEPLADELGVALQLGNIVRDLTEDLAQGRVYVPTDDLERFSCTVHDGRLDGPVELVLSF
jgi:15-cis-phytoene synthase